MDVGLKVPSHLSRAEEVLWAGEALVGGKALGLAELSIHGATVPPWFVIDVRACRAAFDAAGLSVRLRRDLRRLHDMDLSVDRDRAEYDSIAEAMHEAVIRNARPPASTVAAALDELGPGPYAVRSSMVGEDSATHSFAGQLESMMFQSADGVAKAIVRCWASAFSSHALRYGAGIRHTDLPAVAVVVQRMVRGDKSGVAFTAHPVTGRRDHVLINASWGQGEGIVSGLCNADEYTCSHEGHEVSVRVADKDVQVLPRPDNGPGTVETPVSEAMRQKRCLSAATLNTLLQELLRLEHAFGCPMDIEWTFEGDTLYILQARPITRLPPEPKAQGPLIVYDNSNIQESYCGVTTPLTFSFAQRAYASVYAQTMRALGLPESLIRAQQPLLDNMLGLIAGRVYYNINNWYYGLLLLPSANRKKEDMEHMMGLDEPVDFVQDTVSNWRETLQRLPRLLKTAVLLHREIRSLRTEVPAWLRAFERAEARIDRAGFRDAPLNTLFAALDQLREEMLDNWHTPIINDFYVMTSVGRLRRCLRRARIDNADDLLNRLLAGEEGIESTQPVRQLMHLATLIRDDPQSLEILESTPPREVVARLSVHRSDLADLFTAYLSRYGDRCMGELKLETVTVRDDPTFIGQVLRSYAQREDFRPEILTERERRTRQEAEKALKGSLGPVARRRARAALRDARAAVKNREAMRLARTRMFGLYRQTYQAIGRWLHEAGVLDVPDDVFYLTVQELESYHAGRAVSCQLGPITRARRAEFAGFEDMTVPHRIVARAPVYLNMPGAGVAEVPGSSETEEAPQVLHGIGCYPGVVTSELRVVRSPTDASSVNGRILTALRTDPGWAPLFPTCSGILVERGSTLSHSAVVARELGIPAVVGVKDLLAIVKDGERIRLDGGQGAVIRLELPADHENTDVR